MSHLLILFTFLLVNFVTTAQNDIEISIEWGEPTRLSGTEGANPIVGFSGNQFHSVTKTWRYNILNVFNWETLNFQLEYIPNVNQSELKSKNRQYFHFNDKAFLLTSYVDEGEQRKEHFLFREYFSTGMSKGQELVALDWVQTSLRTSPIDIKLRAESLNDCSAMASENSKLLLVQYRTGDQNPVSHTILFDDQMKEIARNTLEISFKNFSVSSVQFSDDGNFYLLGHVDSDYKLLVYNAYSGEIEETELETSIDIYSSSIKLLEDKSIVVYGIYKEIDSDNCGVFIQKLDENFQNVFSQSKKLQLELNPSDEPLSRDEQRQQLYYPNINNSVYKDLNPNEYLLHDLIVMENGDLIFSAEEYSSDVTHTEGTRVISSDGTHSSTGGSHSTHYVYGDIVTFSCSKNGVVKWSCVIDKLQESRNDWGLISSFFTIVEDNSLILIYNESDPTYSANLNLRETNKNKDVYRVRIDNNGDARKNVLFRSNGKKSTYVMPKQCQKLSDNSFLIYGMTKGKKRVLGRLTIK